MKENTKFVITLLAVLAAETIWSYACAYDMQVWWTEFSSVLALLLLFGLTYKKFQFSKTAYFILFAWCVLQIIGACYTFERVPLNDFTHLFGAGRNNYDRIAHFTIGVSSFVVSEFLWRKKIIPSLKWAALFGIIFIMALANFWELVEWIYAEIDGGQAGLAFLGSQGDIWDAQKDMLMDTLGAILGSGLFYIQFKKS